MRLLLSHMSGKVYLIIVLTATPYSGILMETEVTELKIVGERLRALREGVRLSQAQVGKLIGTGQSSIGRYECDVGNPPFHILLWYADYFDVSLDYIFGRTDKPQGKLYDFKPKIEDNDEMRLFIEMCFDPSSPMSGKLKDTLLQMMKGGGDL